MGPHPVSNWTLFNHGEDKADGGYGSQVDRWQGPQAAPRRQGGQKDGDGAHWRRQEAPPLQAGHGGAQGDQEVPKVHGAPHQEATLSAAGQRDRPGLQDRPEVPVGGRRGPAGGQRGLPGRPL